MVGETSYICKEAGYVLHMVFAEPSEERMKIFPEFCRVLYPRKPVSTVLSSFSNPSTLPNSGLDCILTMFYVLSALFRLPIRQR